MDTITIDSGEITLSINNDESRTITFKPTDVRFAESFYGLARSFYEKQKEFEEKEKEIETEGTEPLARAGKEISVTREAFNYMRSEIDKVFGAGTSKTVFGDIDSLHAFAQFFRGIEPYVRKARQAEVERYIGENHEDVMDL